MNNRLNIDNPFYDGNASASAFGWQFQVDAAIFLFLYYIDEVDEIVVEGKYQDIELLCKNSRHIYVEFADYSDLAKEYLIKKCLARLINNKNNIQKIVEGR